MRVLERPSGRHERPRRGALGGDIDDVGAHGGVPAQDQRRPVDGELLVGREVFHARCERELVVNLLGQVGERLDLLQVAAGEGRGPRRRLARRWPRRAAADPA